MSNKKTTLICSVCGKTIYFNEGFYPGEKPRHAIDCSHKLTSRQVKKYKPPKEPNNNIHLPSVDEMYKRRAGFSFDK